MGEDLTTAPSTPTRASDPKRALPAGLGARKIPASANSWRSHYAQSSTQYRSNPIGTHKHIAGSLRQEYFPRTLRQPKMAHHITRLRNRRAFDRHDMNLHATVHLRGGALSVVICNISPAGVRLESAVGLILGDVVTIEIALSRSLAGRVAWASTSSCGVEFQFLLAEDYRLLRIA